MNEISNGGWFPVDSNIIFYLPKGGRFDVIQAYLCLQYDMHKFGKLKACRYYSKQWSWSRSATHRLIEQVLGQKRATLWDKKEPPLFLQINNLQENLGRKRATSWDKSGTVLLKEEVICQKPKKPVSDNKMNFDFSTGKFTNYESNLLKWKEAFPAVDVDQELRKAEAWLLANPANKKSNYSRFMFNWLSRSQENAKKMVRPAIPIDEPYY